ncbi:MAG: alpha/beta hydrolase, partial [Cyanobacteria bacterium P01_E01_bin.35]
MTSVRDRLLPSVTEADRLVRYLPNARKVLLPDSGHACLLEREIRLEEILGSRGFLLNNYGSKPLLVNCPS